MKKILSIGIASLLIPGICFCNTSPVNTTSEYDNTINKAYNNTVSELKSFNKSTTMTRVLIAVTGLAIAGFGVWDMSETTFPSLVCGAPFVVTGAALIIISFQ